MARSDTRIHQIELLLCLDYLLNNTDENHPATQIDICEHATKYGLKFNKNATTGNDVRRQRIGECLKFLKDVSDKFEIPFVLEKTGSGKYYIEQRHGLNEEQVAQILAAISNDKYTSDEKTVFLQERVLSAFSTSEENKANIEREYKRLIRGGTKLKKNVIRKINLIEKAYREQKMILIKQTINGNDFLVWHRVYLIKEIQNKLFAFMLPIGSSDKNYHNLESADRFIFQPIEGINIASGREANILCDDYNENRDFDKLFREKCPNKAKKYATINDMFEEEILPNKGKVCIVSFCFDLEFKNSILKSFEEFFSEKFRYQETNMIYNSESLIPEELRENMDSWTIITDDVKKNESPKYGLANVLVNIELFKSWLISDLIIDSHIYIIKPLLIEKKIATYYKARFLSRMEYLEDKDLLRVIKLLDRERKSRNIE